MARHDGKDSKSSQRSSPTVDRVRKEDKKHKKYKTDKKDKKTKRSDEAEGSEDEVERTISEERKKLKKLDFGESQASSAKGARMDVEADLPLDPWKRREDAEMAITAANEHGEQDDLEKLREMLKYLQEIVKAQQIQLRDLQRVGLSRVLLIKPKQVAIPVCRQQLEAFLKNKETWNYVVGLQEYSVPIILFLKRESAFSQVKELLMKHCPSLVSILQTATATKQQEQQARIFKKAVPQNGKLDKTALGVGWPKATITNNGDSWCITCDTNKEIVCTMHYDHDKMEQHLHMRMDLMQSCFNMAEHEGRSLPMILSQEAPLYPMSLVSAPPSARMQPVGRFGKNHWARAGS